MVHFSKDMTMEDIIEYIDANASGKEYIAPAGTAFLHYKVAKMQIESQTMWNETLNSLRETLKIGSEQNQEAALKQIENQSMWNETLESFRETVKISSEQSDKIANNLVYATWALVGSTIVLVISTILSIFCIK